MSIKYYSIEQHQDEYVVWLNVENNESTYGSFGCRGKFKGTYKECREYCKKNNIKIKRCKNVKD